MNTLLANPNFWAVTTFICICLTTYPFKTERCLILFRVFASFAIAGNALMLGLTLAA